MGTGRKAICGFSLIDESVHVAIQRTDKISKLRPWRKVEALVNGERLRTNAIYFEIRMVEDGVILKIVA